MLAVVFVFATAAVCTAVGAIVGATTASYDAEREIRTWTGAIGGLFLAGYVGGFGLVLYRRQQRRAWYDRVVLLRAHEKLSKAETAAASDDLDLPALWTLTQQRLDYYHSLATSQAEKSFNYGIAAAGAGFLVIIACALAAALGRSAAASVSAALVGLGGGGLAAYIGATFMRLQENSAVQLRAYFSQPLEFSRFLAAERLLARLEPVDSAPATRDLIQALAGGLLPSSDGRGVPDGPNNPR